MMKLAKSALRRLVPRSAQTSYEALARKTGVGARRKAALVEEVLRGEAAPAVAARAGIDAALLAEWIEAYRDAGRSALRYRLDEDEAPTLDLLAISAQRAFPLRLLHGCQSVLSFFCAQFYGKNDIIHVYNAGVPEVTLVDLDEAKLAVMKSLYPAGWNTRVGDAFSVAEELRSAGRRFDVVICDPYTQMAKTVAWDHLALFRALARKYWFVLYTQEMFDELGVAPGSPDLAARLAQKAGCPVEIEGVYRRSSHKGGIYWCVIRAQRAA
jgi:hypothetical protein